MPFVALFHQIHRSIMRWLALGSGKPLIYSRNKKFTTCDVWCKRDSVGNKSKTDDFHFFHSPRPQIKLLKKEIWNQLWFLIWDPAVSRFRIRVCLIALFFIITCEISRLIIFQRSDCNCTLDKVELQVLINVHIVQRFRK